MLEKRTVFNVLRASRQIELDAWQTDKRPGLNHK